MFLLSTYIIYNFWEIFFKQKYEKIKYEFKDKSRSKEISEVIVISWKRH